MSNLLDDFNQACHDFDIEQVQSLLQCNATAYQPSSELCDLVWREGEQSKKPVLTLL
jgi:hypothetical protein